MHLLKCVNDTALFAKERMQFGKPRTQNGRESDSWVYGSAALS
ncbi:hypothetical protein BI49514_02379 [Brevibacterium iodinum ATCC 49514]|uniref:Uncharacterized protein n=1 Tax=Brevibacterium iodinum ATCC 49514 TaxID=1255616 RepID=A0A2H1JUM3_9MICO|nr:hypothetical protein BI49514_02379 [Brevibacterium iodinum ATCC 49514]SUW12379.1 Uncharacterised protein [Brevibacterium iodinum]